MSKTRVPSYPSALQSWLFSANLCMFIMLKVTEQFAAWSWWWLLLPMVPNFAFVFGLVGWV